MKNHLKNISILYLIALSIALLVPLDNYIISQIIEEQNHPNNNTSYIIHFIIFFILYLLFSLSFRNQIKILLFCFTYSIFIETCQIFTMRGFQITDIFFNIVGVICSYIVLSYLLEAKKN